MKTIALSAALALGLAGAAMAQSQDHGVMTKAQIRAQLQQQGYSDVDDLEFGHGMWRAKAESGNGHHVHLRIDARTGKAYPDDQTLARLGKDDVRAALSSAGYTDVHDVDFDDGLWTAKAENSAGKHVKLDIDPDTGKVVGTDD
ncbi:MAG: PepSY domain-containing protein [Pseudomonadota bacterium]